MFLLNLFHVKIDVVTGLEVVFITGEATKLNPEHYSIKYVGSR